MDYGRLAERLFGMDDETWMRHANPASGWTRVATGPVLFLALWSFHWIGPWALVPLALLAVWLRVNPGLFQVPERRDAWMSRGVFGERVWLNRKAVPIPHHHAFMAHMTSAVSMAGFVISVIGLVTVDFSAAALGWVIMMLGKLWFIDRMVWLYEDMRSTNADYASWAEPSTDLEAQ